MAFFVLSLSNSEIVNRHDCDCLSYTTIYYLLL